MYYKNLVVFYIIRHSNTLSSLCPHWIKHGTNVFYLDFAKILLSQEMVEVNWRFGDSSSSNITKEQLSWEPNIEYWTSLFIQKYLSQTCWGGLNCVPRNVLKDVLKSYSLVPVNVTLFANVIRVRSLVWALIQCGMCSEKERKTPCEDSDAKGKCHRQQRQELEWGSCKPGSYRGYEKLDRGKEEWFRAGFRLIPAPWFWMSSLLNCETVLLFEVAQFVILCYGVPTKPWTATGSSHWPPTFFIISPGLSPRCYSCLSPKYSLFPTPWFINR